MEIEGQDHIKQYENWKAGDVTPELHHQVAFDSESPSIPLHMYEIPGQDPITDHSFERYLRDKRQDAEIKETLSVKFNFAENIAAVPDENRDTYISELVDEIKDNLADPDASYTEKFELIRCVNNSHSLNRYQPQLSGTIQLVLESALNSGDPDAQSRAMFHAHSLPDEDKSKLIMQALEIPSAKSRKEAGRLAWSLPDDEREKAQQRILTLVQEGLKSQNESDRQTSVQMISGLPINQQMPLIEEALLIPDIKTQVGILEGNYNVFNGQYVRSRETQAIITRMLAPKILTALRSSDSDTRAFAAKYIATMPNDQRPGLIEAALASGDFDTQFLAANLIKDVEERGVSTKLKEDVLTSLADKINNGNKEDIIRSVKLIRYVPAENIAQLIRDLTQNPDIDIQKAASDQLAFVPYRDRTDLIKEFLKSQNPILRKAALNTIPFSKEPAFIEELLDSDDIEAQKAAARSIEARDVQNTRVLFELAVSKGFVNEVVEPPIYSGLDISSDHFSRQQFFSGGLSDTEVVGGDLYGKTIIRHMAPITFTHWQELFEDFELWQAEGFDYVPIEPIQSYRLTKGKDERDKIDVYTGILDLNLKQWKNRSDKFVVELDEQKQKIIDGLKKVNMELGDPHDANFCLRFFRDENGNVDLNKMPRIYMIDFGQLHMIGR